MLHRLFGIAVLALALLVPTSAAEAKKVPIPCSGDRFVAIPTPAFDNVTKAKGLHLAYRFSGCSGEGFVAYDGNTRYMPLTAEIMAATEKEQGAPIAAPGLIAAFFKAPGQFSVEWFYLLLIGGFGLFALFKAHVTKIVGRDEMTAGVSATTADAAQPATGHVARTPTAAPAVATSTPAPRAARPAAAFATRPAQAGFGKAKPREARAFGRTTSRA